MDDFGTGYSSLSYLKKFPIDIIKIDRSFIHEIPDNQDDMEITSAVIAMAHNLKLKVVAEGVETAEQLSFLRRHRCDVGQGYLFDRPIPGNELIEKLKRYPRGPIA
jgi:EAL domain-containing protein (putative c-di-GMP-specific phosphodiesterase class I)